MFIFEKLLEYFFVVKLKKYEEKMTQFNMSEFMAPLDKDVELMEAMIGEATRQEDHLELIASENYASVAIMQAQGSILTNKYAEGYPGKRYYGGCEYVDEVERIAIKRANELFGTQFANVQAHSGSQANQSVFFALLEVHDVILGLDLSSGGHLTHGATVNVSGKNYQAVTYGLNREGWIDLNQVRDLAKKHKPKLIIAGASAYSRAIEWDVFASIAKETGALLMADMAHYSGLIAGGLYPSPVGHADIITSTTHKTLRGPRGGFSLTDSEAIAKKINSAIFPGLQGGPLMHVIAAKAICFAEASQPEFKLYGQQMIANARALANRFMEHGYNIVSGGTDSHLLLLDLRIKDIKGSVAQKKLEQVGITVNKNSVPGDHEKPTITSGIRLGTPALTTRGMGVEEMRRIADIIDDVLMDNIGDEVAKRKVRELVVNFGLYR